MKPRFTGSPASGLFGATLGFFVGFAAVALFGPTAKAFREAMGLGPVGVGFLVAMPNLSGSLLRIPFAAWVDTTGGRKPFLVLFALSLAGMAGLTAVVAGLYPDGLTAGLYPLLLVLGFLCGCGIATFSVGIGQVSYWYPRESQGRALAIFAGLGNLAPGLFSFLIPVALSGVGLAGAYVAWLVFLGVGVALYALFGRNAWYFQARRQGADPTEARQLAAAEGQRLFPAGGVKESLANAAKVWRTWSLVAMYFTTFGGFLALTVWLPTFWTESFGVGLKTAGVLTAVYALLASLIRVGGGVLADRQGGENTAMISLAVMLGGGILMATTSSFGLAVAAEVFLAIGMGVGNAAVFKILPEAVPDAVGGAAGWVGGLGAVGGFVVPPILSAIVDWRGPPGYALGFLVFAGLAVVSLALTALLKVAPTPAVTMEG